MNEVKITKKKQEDLQQLGINNTSDLLEYYPYRYESLQYKDFEKWLINDKVVVSGIVTKKPTVVRFRSNQCVINFELTTEMYAFRISVFNQVWYAKQEVGSKLTVIGKYQGNGKILASRITTESIEAVIGIKPVYSLKDKVTPRYFSQLVNKALDINKDEIKDFIPKTIIRENSLISRYEALKEVHFPTTFNNLNKAIETLKYEEFFKFQCCMQARKKETHIQDASLAKVVNIKQVREFIYSLPYELTGDQKTVVNEIVADLKQEYQMCRLLQGDVGSGKTIVSFIAMYSVVTAGYQACLMAPTEALAKQHYKNIVEVFAGFNLKIELLYSSMDNKKRKEVLVGLADGSIDMVVGTHALFQNEVEMKNLGLIVIDEQHRFGVKQRQLLQDKGEKADLLLMSATPIPRTLAISLYGDMDVSTINETPNRGKVIHTKLIKQNSFISELNDIERLLKEGNQMYVVCAAIEKNNETPTRNVNDIYKNLSQYFKGRYTIGLLHGQMSEEEKDEVQSAFVSGEINILVATTVIEVGLDVKNANIMVIYDANRFGLSQLHQLRGRVGRGNKEGYCYLLTSSNDEEAIKRLEVIVNNMDGFKISYYDLQLRGPGDLLGYRQSGLPSFRIGNVVDDVDLFGKASSDAKKVISDIDNEEYSLIKEYVKSIEEKTVYLD